MRVEDEPGGSADAPDKYYYDDSFDVKNIEALPSTSGNEKSCKIRQLSFN